MPEMTNAVAAAAMISVMRAVSVLMRKQGALHV